LATDRRALLLILVLGGCTVGPDFTSPNTASPDNWFHFTAKPAQPKTTAVETSIAVTAPIQADWWQVFDDSELETLEQRAVRANLDLQTAELQLEESRQQAAEVYSARYPNAAANASYVREKASDEGLFSALNSPTGTSASGANDSSSTASGSGGLAGGVPGSLFNPFNLLSYGLDASWELDFWGQVRREVENSKANVVASQDAERNAMVTVLAEVARDYVQLRGIQQDYLITQENLRIDNDSLRLTQDRYNGGLTTELDVENAQTQSANVAAQLPSLEQQENEMINALSLLLAEPPNALRAELVDARAVPPVPPEVPIGLPSELLRRRPDIQQAEAQLHAATANIGVAVSQFYPQITISGSFSLQALQVSNMASWNARQYAFGPNITMPLFEGGKLRAQLKLSQAQQKAAAVAYRNTVLTAWHEVANALDAYEAEQRRRAQLEVAVRSGRAATELAQQRYTQGIADFLNVLDAQTRQLSAERQLSDSTATLSSDLVAIYKALGGGWDATDLQQASR
jgi:NodT family efflux transporter outer membrane factor (OMF) lipoprotein